MLGSLRCRLLTARSAEVGGLVSPRLALSKTRWVSLFDGLVGVVGRRRANFAVFVARYPCEDCDGHGRGEHDEYDENGTAGGHIGSLRVGEA
jgi:hypothetical protein